MELIKLDLALEAIKVISKDAFQKLVKVAIHKAAFVYLNSEQQKRDKVKHVEHRYLKLQPYLCPGQLEIKEAKLLCMGTCIDSQENVLESSVLLLNCNIVAKNKVEYSWIYSMDVGKQAEVTRIFQTFWNLRKKFLDKDED